MLMTQHVARQGDVVDVDADGVAHAVHVVLAHLGDVLDHAHCDQAFPEDLARDIVQISRGDPRLRSGGHGLVGLQDQLVDFPLPRAVLPVDRIGPGDVAAIVLIPDAQVQQDQGAVLRLAVIGLIVHHAAVEAGARNGGEGLTHGAQPPAGILKVRLDLILHHPRLQVLHHEFQALPGDVHGLANAFHLLRVLLFPEGHAGRVQVLQDHLGIGLPEPFRHDQVIVRQIVHLAAVEVEVGLLHPEAPQKAADRPFQTVRVAHVLDAGDLPDLLYGGHLSRPPLGLRVRLLDEEDLPDLLRVLVGHEGRVLPLQPRQVEILAVDREGAIGVLVGMDGNAGIGHH